VFGFSQQPQNIPADPQVFELNPDIVPRAWHWDLGGTQPSDDDWSDPQQVQAQNLTFIAGGTNTTVSVPR